MLHERFYRRGLLSVLSILLLAFSITNLVQQANAQANPGDAYIYAPSTRTVSAVSVFRTVGTVTNANARPSTASPSRISGVGSYMTVDFDKEVGGIVTLNFSGASGANQSVGLAFSESSNYVGTTSDESANCCGRSDGALMITVSGAGTYTMPTNKLRGGFRYLTIFVNSSGWVDLSGISLNYTIAPAMPNPRAYPNYFYSNDDLLNKIWYAGAYTVQTNTINPNQGRIWPPPATGWDNGTNVGVGTTILTDGAKRDRTVWPGDMGIAVTTAYVSTNDMLSTKNALQTLYNMQKTTGELPYSGPAFSFFASDTYHMWTLLGTWNYYLYSADSTWVSSIWSKYKLGVTFITNKISANGLLNVTGTNDWARCCQGGENIAANALLYRVLITGANLADRMSDPTLASNYRNRAASLKTQINARLWTGGGYKDNPTSTMLPQDGNALALWYDVFDTPDKVNTISNMLASRWNAYGSRTPEWNNDVHPFIGGMEVYGNFRIGQDQRAIDLIRRTWGYMLNSPIGTKSTFWEGITATGGLAYSGHFMSLAHGWSSGPTGALTTYALGVDPDSAGGQTYHVIPHPGDLTHAEGRLTMAPGKTVSVSYNRSCSSFSMVVDATSHTGSIGVIGVPKFAPNQTMNVQINGVTVWNGTSFSGSAGIASADQDANYVYFRGVQPGSRTFSAAGGCNLPTNTPPPSSWTFCANENQTCSFTGTRQVRYGANGQYSYRIATGSIACNNTVFGDPILNTPKTCEYSNTQIITPTPMNSGWTFCANENQVCTFSGTRQVRYGVNGVYSYGTFTGSVVCSNENFADPVMNTAKTCEYSNTVISTPTPPPSGWTFCANENQTCSFTGTRQVRYGANGVYAYGTFTGSVLCANSVFGDPVPNTVKTCEYSNTTSNPNLALNKPTIASTICASTESSEKAVNGSVSGGNSDKWCAPGTSNWLRVDLGANYSLTSFTVKHAGAGGENTTYNTRAFLIETSTDGNTWTQRVAVPANTASITNHAIVAVTARYVRLYVTQPEQGTGGAARIYEFEVYGSGPVAASVPASIPTNTATR